MSGPSFTREQIALIITMGFALLLTVKKETLLKLGSLILRILKLSRPHFRFRGLLRKGLEGLKNAVKSQNSAKTLRVLKGIS